MSAADRAIDGQSAAQYLPDCRILLIGLTFCITSPRAGIMWLPCYQTLGLSPSPKSWVNHGKFWFTTHHHTLDRSPPRSRLARRLLSVYIICSIFTRGRGAASTPAPCSFVLDRARKKPARHPEASLCLKLATAPSYFRWFSTSPAPHLTSLTPPRRDTSLSREGSPKFVVPQTKIH